MSLTWSRVLFGSCILCLLMLQADRHSPHRRQWLLEPHVAFLNHGSFGACPKPILALQQELRLQMERAPVQFLWRHFEERLEPARAQLARFIGARKQDVVFVTNATSGVNAVLRSFPLERGDELLTTDHDYNACHNVLKEVARERGAQLVTATVPFPITNPDQVIEAILQRVTRRTRLAMIDHVTSPTALIYPVERIVRELETRGIATLVDGAHAPGQVALDLAKLQPAFYTGNLHKWVCAPKGAAFLWARADQQDGLHPAIISHGHNRPRPGYTAFQDRFDWAGTADPTPWFCVDAAIRWMSERVPGGWLELRRRNHALALEARALLCAELKVAPPAPGRMLGSMATIPLPRSLQTAPRMRRGFEKIEPEQLRLYDEFCIEVPLLRLHGRRWLRISAQLYNTPRDYVRLAHALRTIAVVK
jgi:isopenicillin-N epimerase